MRIAAHKSRRGCSTALPAGPVPTWTGASRRASEALARVAARYANAPSYSQMQAAQARAVTAADGNAIPKPANETNAAEPADVGLPAANAAAHPLEHEALYDEESARSSVLDWEPAVPPMIAAAPSSLEEWENDFFHNRLERDLRLRPVEPVSASFSSPVQAPAAESEPRPVDGLVSSYLTASHRDSSDRAKWEWPELARGFSNSEEIEPAEPDLPIHANLIEFPRELVATRKMRPRRAEGPFAASRPEAQLSIFEVDPAAISTRPDTAAAVAVAVWPEPAWAEIELEPQAQEEAELEEMPAELQELQLAPIRQRMIAALTDSALIAALVLGPVLVAGAKVGYPHPTKIVELCTVLVLLIAGVLYHALFLMLAGATPGMSLAGISLCTFDGEIPTREQLRSRVGALLLSLVPVGLGIAWALFDDDRLSWHDRLSRTYLREN